MKLWKTPFSVTSCHGTMGWFSKRNAQQRDEEPRIDTSGTLLTETAEQVSRLIYDMQQLRIEWSDTLDKIVRYQAKQAARDRRELQKLAGETNGAEGIPTLGGVPFVDPAPNESDPDAQRAAEKAALWRQYRNQRGH